MGTFPFFIEVENKKFLIIGGGKVAARKVSRLLAFTGNMTVVAPDTSEVEKALAQATESEYGAEKVKVVNGAFARGMLEGVDYCIAATDSVDVNAEIAAECTARGIPVNVANAPHLCTWEFPALVKRGDLTVAVSTSGSSPAYAKMLRKQIEEMLPTQICGILERMTALRDALPQKVPDQKSREKIYRSMLAALVAADNALSDEELAEMTDQEIQRFTE